jgi:hypothetical protein
MDPIDQLRKQIRVVTGELWTRDRVATLSRHTRDSAHAIRAVQLAKRIKRRLESGHD